ncbi:spermidine/putrescine ABC transporter substrate-binding protein [Vermiphilus pyriformis]|uniref:ABC transporter substrate-binding protein n=1 Tax=candidate division TM6 bacterium JCVI TM6SC1 TaxID=1306947 RepID=A0A0D2GQD2_9BACT|nr:hypothetical protein J120_01315 [candidate division TM6 bacterium JCVI TM6SC1]UNE35744.1 MAG: spermidine/putrescine ABC transporter substrate-binding protein [Vermiphilus pyriformis]
MIYQYFYKRLFVWLLIICFWLSVIGLFILSPLIGNYIGSGRNTLNIFTWPRLLDPGYIEQFEKETGIKVNISYYESNQDLYSKILSTKGKGYDLIIPSDHTIELLARKGFLKVLDHSKFTFWNDINPGLLGHYFDKDNKYSVPFFWGVYGLGINKAVIDAKLREKPSWSLIFDSRNCPANTIAMTDDARDMILITAQYLFGSIDNLTEEKLQQITDTLILQKKCVQIYTEARAEDVLLGRSASIVTTMGPALWNALQYDPQVSFIIPVEGTFAVIDSLAIPESSTKAELAYKFINYLFRPDILAYHLKKYGFCSPSLKVSSSVAPSMCQLPGPGVDFFRNVISLDKVNDIWVSLMAS